MKITGMVTVKIQITRNSRFLVVFFCVFCALSFYIVCYYHSTSALRNMLA